MLHALETTDVLCGRMFFTVGTRFEDAIKTITKLYTIFAGM
jgi:hypothetical protein